MFPRKGTGLEHPDALLRNWRGEFTAQYKRGRYFQVTLHPQHICWSNRLQLLDEFLAELRGYPGLWNPPRPNAHDIGWNLPCRTQLRLEQSIWQDYPGSLSWELLSWRRDTYCHTVCNIFSGEILGARI
jgi:hypothetical protein